MYRVIRCPGCRTFTYVDQFQKWKLCPVCGETVNVSKAPIYLEVRDHRDAEEIVAQLGSFLQRTRKRDLSEADLAKLRENYTQWVKTQI
jgi:acetyl-CoA carboxylase beta subunit